MTDQTFRNLKQAAAYLREEGYKISKTQIYCHAREQKVKPREDGKFYKIDVQLYADQYLKNRNAVQRPHSIDEELRRRRNEAEAAKLEAQARHWQLKTDVAAGKFVPAASFERELSYRAMIFKNDLETLARSRSPEICRLVGGDNDHIPTLTEYLLAQFAIFLNRYSEPREFHVPVSMNYSEASKAADVTDSLFTMEDYGDDDHDVQNEDDVT